MSTVPFDQLNDVERSQLVCTLSALILHDDKSDITADKLKNIVKASGNTIPDYWPSLFSKALEGKDVSSLLSVGGGSGSSGPVQETANNNQQEEKKEEVVEEEEEDIDIGDMFG